VLKSEFLTMFTVSCCH